MTPPTIFYVNRYRLGYESKRCVTFVERSAIRLFPVVPPSSSPPPLQPYLGGVSPDTPVRYRQWSDFVAGIIPRIQLLRRCASDG